MAFSGAIFDFDGTLADSLGFWDDFWVRLGRHFGRGEGYAPPPDLERRSRTSSMPEMAAMVHSEEGIGESADEVLAFILSEVRDYYRTRTRLKDGVREFLLALRERGIPLCLASATSRPELLFGVECFGIADLFDRILSCSEVGRGKDAPDVFLEALRTLGTPLAETYVFEDSLLALKTARDAGFRTVGIYDSHAHGTEEAARLADHYVGEGETLLSLLPTLLP